VSGARHTYKLTRCGWISISVSFPKALREGPKEKPKNKPRRKASPATEAGGTYGQVVDSARSDSSPRVKRMVLPVGLVGLWPHKRKRLQFSRASVQRHRAAATNLHKDCMVDPFFAQIGTNRVEKPAKNGLKGLEKSSLESVLSVISSRAGYVSKQSQSDGQRFFQQTVIG
jgi:hypothetical protein